MKIIQLYDVWYSVICILQLPLQFVEVRVQAPSLYTHVTTCTRHLAKRLKQLKHLHHYNDMIHIARKGLL